MEKDIDRNVDATTADDEDIEQESTLATAENPLRTPSSPTGEA
jgi:hypothetical protein